MSEDLVPFLSHFYNDILLGPELNPECLPPPLIRSGLWTISSVFAAHEPAKCSPWLLRRSVIPSIIAVCPWRAHSPTFWAYFHSISFSFLLDLGLTIPLYLRVLRYHQIDYFFVGLNFLILFNENVYMNKWIHLYLYFTFTLSYFAKVLIIF